jgi:type IV pilus assembly protein PilP
VSIRIGDAGASRARLVAGARLVCVIALAGFVTAGCSGGQSDLQRWIAETKKKPGGRIQPLPEVKPYESFVYSASNMRSPFQPASPNLAGAGVRPSVRRNREFLEGFSLDTLKMVGTFKVGNNFYGLVQSKDGLVHKVQPGNYLGQNDGKVTEITGSRISLVEIIPDGLGGYIERPASLALQD